MAEVQVVNVFISAPGDVPDAKESVRRAVDRINRLVGPHVGVMLKAIGSEDIPPAIAGRAQEVINPYVDGSHLFFGLLSQRFGTPTGIAESGVEEEFRRAVERNKAGGSPEILMYFKGVPDALLKEPTDQLKAVLRFKDQIRGFCFYRDFDTSEELRESVEEALAKWLYEHKPKKLEAKFSQVEPEHLKLLEPLLRDDLVPLNFLKELTGMTEAQADACIPLLLQLDLISQDANGALSLRYTLQALSRLVDQFSKHDRTSSLLDTPALRRLLSAEMANLLSTRFHLRIDDEWSGKLCRLATLSPSTLEYLVLGDTSSYDNRHDQIMRQKMSGEALAHAYEMGRQSIIHESLLRCSKDMHEGRFGQTLEGEPVVGTLVRLDVRATRRKDLILNGSVVMPMIRFKAGGPIKAGELVSMSNVGMHLECGTALLNMGEPKLAIEHFDQLIAQSQDPQLQAEALNNKGLALLNLNHFDDAERCLRTALEKAPDMKQAKDNLELLMKLRGVEKEPTP